MNLKKEGYTAIVPTHKLPGVFGVSRWTLKAWIEKKGFLKAFEVVTLPNGRLGITRSSLQEWIDSKVEQSEKLLCGN